MGRGGMDRGRTTTYPTVIKKGELRKGTLSSGPFAMYSLGDYRWVNTQCTQEGDHFSLWDQS